MATFYLKVVNPVIPSGATQPNVDWYESDGTRRNSDPNGVMPTATQAVRFDTVLNTGKLDLVTYYAGTWRGGPRTSTFTVQDGATYIWDMQANTISQEAPAQEQNLTTLLVLGGIALVGYWWLKGR